MDFTLYTGVTTFVFALLGIKQFFKQTSEQFALLLFILTIIIIVANPLSIFLYKLGIWGGAPVTMNRANFLINFSLAILGAYGLSLVKNYSKLSLKPLILLFSIASLAIIDLLIFATIPHINISLRNLILPVFLLIIILLCILLTKRSKMFRPAASLAFIIILIFELFRFGWKFNTFSQPAFIYPKTPISGYLEKFPNDRFAA